MTRGGDRRGVSKLTEKEQRKRALQVIRFAVSQGYGPQTDAEVAQKVHEVLAGERALPGKCPTPNKEYWRQMG
jgi:hypothetical protein